MPRALPALVLACLCGFAWGNSPREIPNAQIDYDGFARDVDEVRGLRAERRLTEEEFARMAREPGTVVLDARSERLYRLRHVRGAVNIPLHELIDRENVLPVGEVWVHCASGYRASIAASILDRHGRDVVLIDDGFDRAAELNLTADAR